MIIPIASDHAGYKMKEKVKKMIEDYGHMIVDFGTHSEDSVDYPDFAVKVAQSVNDGEYEQGVLVCGTGQGMCMTANKLNGIRAALVYNKEVARLSRGHNDANIICLPGSGLEEDDLKEIFDTWFSQEFEGGRHERRVNKIQTVTKDTSKTT